MPVVSALSSLLLVSLLLGPAAGTGSNRGSLIVGWSQRSEGAYFVGVALPDTIRAGKGAVRFSSDDIEAGRNQPAPIFGQLVRLEKLGGRGTDVAERALHNLNRVMAHFRRHNGHRHAKLICCDPADASDSQSRELLDTLVGALWNADKHGVA